jgi:hypothetical protein
LCAFVIGVCEEDVPLHQRVIREWGCGVERGFSAVSELT